MGNKNILDFGFRFFGKKLRVIFLGPLRNDYYRLGGRFVRIIRNAVRCGLITDLDAYEITGIKPKYLEGVFEESVSRRATYGPPS